MIASYNYQDLEQSIGRYKSIILNQYDYPIRLPSISSFGT